MWILRSANHESISVLLISIDGNQFYWAYFFMSSNAVHRPWGVNKLLLVKAPSTVPGKFSPKLCLISVYSCWSLLKVTENQYIIKNPVSIQDLSSYSYFVCFPDKHSEGSKHHVSFIFVSISIQHTNRYSIMYVEWIH